MPGSVHDGHRKRVKQQFLRNGFDMETPPHKLLEMLLFYSIPRKDTNELAHELLNRFGTLNGVLSATPEQLMEVKGVSANTACLIKFAGTFNKIAYFQAKKNRINISRSFDDAYELLSTQYFALGYEMFSAVTFKSNGQMIAWEVLGKGANNAVNVSLRDIVKLALGKDVATMIIAHNHPAGIALPSAEDIELTRRVGEALANVGAGLIDHVIFSDDDYVSMRQSKSFRYLFLQNNSK